MKYNRILCWVRPQEKKEIKEAVNAQFPLVFAKNFDDFKAKIKKGDFLVFSIVKATKGFKKCQQLVREFPDHVFNLYYRDDGIITENEINMFLEKNVYQGQQTSKGILLELGADNEERNGI